MPWWYGTILLAANLALWGPMASWVRVTGALLLIGLLPGLGWANRFLPASSPLLRWTGATALSYTITGLAMLFLHFLPGPIETWQLLITLDLVAVLPYLTRPKDWKIERLEDWKTGWFKRLSRTLKSPSSHFQLPHLPPLHPSTFLTFPLPLLLILVVSLLLRSLDLGYSEFQGDEALAMIAAAEALSGHEDALFLRSKGPGEVLLPMALWRLTGTMTEAIARLPFTLAALLAIVTIYMLAKKAGGQRLGWLAAGFFAFNGFMVAFGRIVQYQALVTWLSALAFLLVVEWFNTGQQRLVALGGVCLGTGLLAHYDAVLVLPAVAWLLVANGLVVNGRWPAEKQSAASAGPAMPGSSPIRLFACSLRPALLFLFCLLLAALPFYLPYALDPQANRTGDYVGQRIGNELRNNLPAFFHFNTFYSSTYYTLVTGLLVLGLLSWYAWQASGRRWWAPAVILLGVLAVIVEPALLAGTGINLAALPFALLLLVAFLGFSLPPDRATPGGVYRQAVIAWLAIPFLGYNFVVTLGLTHIYTIVPAWSLLAALGWHHLFQTGAQRFKHSNVQTFTVPPASPSIPPALPLPNPPLLQSSLLLLLLLLSTVFLWNAFIRHDVEYWQDYPAGNLPLFWTPYSEPPTAGFFGFAHRTGWKAVGQKIAGGEWVGDYSSNEEPDVTAWYTRGAPRACDPQPEFYFLAADLIDPVETPGELIASNYEQIGTATLPNKKQMQIMQQKPVTLHVGELPEAALAQAFDQTATPAAFARSARGAIPVDFNFSRLVRLIGYDLNNRRAYPGGRVAVTLYWQALAPLPASYQVFTHLEQNSAGPVAQADGVPVCWTYPTDLWRPGQIIADQHAIPIPSGAPPGDYPLQVGLYLADTFERLDVLDEAGNPAGTSVTLATLTVSREPESRSQGQDGR